MKKERQTQAELGSVFFSFRLLCSHRRHLRSTVPHEVRNVWLYLSSFEGRKNSRSEFLAKRCIASLLVQSPAGGVNSTDSSIAWVCAIFFFALFKPVMSKLNILALRRLWRVCLANRQSTRSVDLIILMSRI